eukprot:SAG31_NODE_17220_length_679_cov_0.655172_1_plen_202_part_01
MAEIQCKTIDCISTYLVLIGKSNVGALQTAVSDLVDLMGDLLAISQEYQHVQSDCTEPPASSADGNKVHVVCMEQFGRRARLEVFAMNIPSGTAALHGTAAVLKCLQQYAQRAAGSHDKTWKGADLCCEHALRSCANKLWPAFRATAQGDAGHAARLATLELMDYMMSRMLLPDFVDLVLSVLSAALSTPQSDFWSMTTSDV